MTIAAPTIDYEDTLAALLESCRAQLLESKAHSPIQALMRGLDKIRAGVSNIAWRNLVATAREHATFRLLMQDPYTARAFLKPRGYAGDAVMLDYVYGPADHSSVYSGATDIGTAVHAYTAVASPAAKAVRWRRNWIASEIETMALTAKRPLKLLSFACGHLREYEQVHPLLRERACTWTAADQDHESLDHVRKSYDARTVRCSPTAVRGLLSGSQDLESDYDVVYTLGLFDYLTDRLAVRVMGALWRHVAAGGRLVVANFSPDAPGAGYMEMFMDWWLIYRTRAGLQGCTADIPTDQIKSVETMSDPQEAVHYLILERN